MNEITEALEGVIPKLPESQSAFQIQISQFASKTALINVVSGQESFDGIIPITNKPIALDQVLTKNGLSLSNSHIVQIHLTRAGETYTFTLNDNASKTQKIYLQPNDSIKVERLNIKKIKFSF